MKLWMLEHRTAHALLGGLLGLLASGCGSPGVGDLSGTVSVRGTPLVYGTVTFVGADGVPRSGVIQPDGRYSVTGIPAGETRVAVVSPPVPKVELKLDVPSDTDPEQYKALEQERAATAARVAGVDRKKWQPIGKNYADFNTSGLIVTVTSGVGIHDIDLK